MPVYTVHEPPLRGSETSVNPDRFSFVRDGFYVWAFLFPPLWMIAHRLWLVLVIYLGVGTLLMVVLHLLGAGETGLAIAHLLLMLLIGFEAGTLRRWTLRRRGYTERGAVVGDDQDSAEQRFFSEWVKQEPETERTAIAAAPGASVPMRSAPQPDVIGLFPEPDTRR